MPGIGIPSERLSLRQLTTSDVDLCIGSMAAGDSECCLPRYADAGTAWQESVQRVYAPDNPYGVRTFGMFELESGSLVGCISLATRTGEVEAWVGSQFRSRGYAREAMAALLPAFQVICPGLRIHAHTARPNVAAQRLLEASGFRFHSLAYDERRVTFLRFQQ